MQVSFCYGLASQTGMHMGWRTHFKLDSAAEVILPFLSKPSNSSRKASDSGHLQESYMALLKMPEASRTISSNCNDQKQSVQTIYVISGLKTRLKYTQTYCNCISSTCSQINGTSKEIDAIFRKFPLLYCMGLGSLW